MFVNFFLIFFFFLLGIGEFLIIKITTVDKFFRRELMLMLIILLMIGFSFGEFLITGRRLLTIVMMMIIFHGLVEVGLCGD